MFKIETHLHTPIISPCGKVSPEELVDRYYAAGYNGLIVTDHYHLGVFETKLAGAADPLGSFFEGYRQVKHYADQVGIRTYCGAELRFCENSNDYLLYGFSEQLISDPYRICQMGLCAFSELARQDGALLIQAHPFRKGCIPVAPYLVDGVEVINRHDCHVNRNDLAMALALRYNLLKTSGSDFHDPEDRCIGGIEADWLPNDSQELVQLLRSGKFRLLGSK